MRVLWLTDIHLDHMDPAGVQRYARSVSAWQPDAIFITGDISNGERFSTDLDLFRSEIPRQIDIFFVLGNHDFYRSSVPAVKDLARNCPGTAYLERGKIHPLSLDTAVVGVDGWADAKAGEFFRSTLELSDRTSITELSRAFTKKELATIMSDMGEKEAADLDATLLEAVEKYQHVYVLTHIPPWREAAWHEGTLCNLFYAPYFCCISTGQVLENIAKEFPSKRITVLCGHTHSPGIFSPAPNLSVYTGSSRYGDPGVSGVFYL